MRQVMVVSVTALAAYTRIAATLVLGVEVHCFLSEGAVARCLGSGGAAGRRGGEGAGVADGPAADGGSAAQAV